MGMGGVRDRGLTLTSGGSPPRGGLEFMWNYEFEYMYLGGVTIM